MVEMQFRNDDPNTNIATLDARPALSADYNEKSRLSGLQGLGFPKSANSDISSTNPSNPQLFSTCIGSKVLVSCLPRKTDTYPTTTHPINPLVLCLPALLSSLLLFAFSLFSFTSFFLSYLIYSHFMSQ